MLKVVNEVVDGRKLISAGVGTMIIEVPGQQPYTVKTLTYVHVKPNSVGDIAADNQIFYIHVKDHCFDLHLFELYCQHTLFDVTLTYPLFDANDETHSRLRGSMTMKFTNAWIDSAKDFTHSTQPGDVFEPAYDIQCGQHARRDSHGIIKPGIPTDLTITFKPIDD